MTFRPEYMDWLDEIEVVCSEYNLAVLYDIESAFGSASYNDETDEEIESPQEHLDLAYAASQAEQALDDLDCALKAVRKAK